jgi:hypothetical protein
MFEEWCYSKQTLQMMSENLPYEMVEKLNQSRKLLQGYHYARQLMFGIFDMKMHSKSYNANSLTPAQVFAQLQKDILQLQELNDDDLEKILQRAENILQQKLLLTTIARQYLISSACGDARYLINACEQIFAKQNSQKNSPISFLENNQQNPQEILLDEFGSSQAVLQLPREEPARPRRHAQLSIARQAQQLRILQAHRCQIAARHR